VSTLPKQANVSSSWKQEVNQRVAAHKDRRTSSVTEPEGIFETHHNASSRAAAAAARVAARYANAPSYSELLAGEARAAVRAAEAASKAALEAQAAAESVLAGLEAANAAAPEFELQAPVAEFPAEAEDREMGAGAGQAMERRAPEAEVYEIRWEPDMPVRPIEPAAVRATHGTEIPEAAPESWREQAWPGQDGRGDAAIEAVEPAQPIHANLIEFPREIVATRKVRPRLAEGSHAVSGGQLSIFEVDPGSISLEPAVAGAVDLESAPSWTGPEWSGIELDAQPRREFLEQAPIERLPEPVAQTDEGLDGARHVEIAPMNLRLMAVVVNGSLVMGALVVAALVAAFNMKDLPPLREIEVGAALGLAVIGGLYHLLFYAFAKGTPGTKYAGVALCTFDGRNPTRAQRLRRLMSLLVSILPVGLGVLWSIFDEDRLSWHDRLSQTYLRKY
jgi:uncharacterized RDD family membrane protein YckC